MTWYADRKEDPLFSSPIRKFHADEYWLDTALSKKHFSAQVNDDEITLSEGEFARFAQEVKEGKFGELMFLLAHLQYDHSLRICEAAALMWSDIRWDKSEIKFQRHIEYIHNDRKNNPDLIVPGLKNKRHVKRRGGRYGGSRPSLSKTHPFFPHSSTMLKEFYLRTEKKEGLVFVNPETNSFFEYKCIQDKFNRAFQRAGLEYRGTHIVRYGGVNRAAKHTDDEKMLLDLLGNQKAYDYIRRKPNRLKELVKKLSANSL